jgi:hypothetical protein
MKDDLKSYIDELDENIRIKEDEYTNRDEAFTAYVIEEIAELINLGEYKICHASKKDSGDRVQGEIYGYCLSDNAEVLTLFYSLYNPTANIEIKTLYDSEYQTAINRMQGFYKLALRGLSLDLEDADQKSSPLFEPADEIYKNHANITSVRLIVLSNSIINKYDIKDIRINGKIVISDVWDLKKIYAHLHSGQDHVAIDIDFKEDYKNFKIPFIKMDSTGLNSNYKCIIALFPAKLLYQLYERHNTDLLLNNVRFFLGFKGSKKTNANIGILNTLKNESQMFLAYNNGITALARGIESAPIGEQIDITDESEKKEGHDFISMGILSAINDFRIVNGGQTTAAIFSSKRNNQNTISLYGVYVQVKIIVLSDDINQIAGNITKYSNSQSKIKYSDFTVSNSFNTTMEQLSRKILYPNANNEPKYWYFERVRGQYDQEKKNLRTKEEQKLFDSKFPKEKKFKKEEIAKVWKSWQQEPYDAVKGESTNYELFMNKILESNLTPDEIYYRKTIVLMIIYRFLMSVPENKRYGNRKATIVAYAISYLSYATYGRLNFEKIWASQDLSDNLKVYLIQLCESLYAALQELAGDMSVLSWGKRKLAFKDITSCKLKCDKTLLNQDIM